MQVVFLQHVFQFSDLVIALYVFTDLVTRCMPPTARPPVTFAGVCLVIFVPLLLKPLLARGAVREIPLALVRTCRPRQPSHPQIGTVADVAGALTLGFVRNKFALFSSRSVGFVDGFATPMLRALVSKHSAQDEQVRRRAADPSVTAACRAAHLRHWRCWRPLPALRGRFC